MALGAILLLSASATALTSPTLGVRSAFAPAVSRRALRPSMDGALGGKPVAAAAAGALAFSLAQSASAARSGGRVGGRVSGGGGGMRGGGGGGMRGGGAMGGGGVTNVYMQRPMFSPFGFGYSPFGFSPFGFGMGFGLPGPLLLLAAAGLAVTSFRGVRGIEGGGGVSDDTPGAAYCLQVACYCEDRQSSLFGRLNGIAQKADTQSYEGLQQLVSDACLAMLRSSNDWLAGRTESKAAGVFDNDVESNYNKLVVQERAKWEVEQGALSRNAPGQPTYMVATLVVLLKKGSGLPDISGVADLRSAISQLAADVAVDGNLLGAEVLWTPEDPNDVMDRDDLFLNFPALVSI